MRLSLLRAWAAVLVLAPSTCDAVPDESGADGRPDSAMRMPRVSIVVEMDVLGTTAPGIRARVARSPNHESR